VLLGKPVIGWECIIENNAVRCRLGHAGVFQEVKVPKFLENGRGWW
jgi:hypothetical protein